MGSEMCIRDSKRIDRVTNSDVLQRASRANLSDILMKRQLRTLGHWLRRPSDTTANRYALYTTNEGRGRRVRPRTKNVCHITSVTNMDVAEIRRMAADRDEWRRLVVGRGDSRAPD